MTQPATPAPVYCSIETLATRLDCSTSTIRAKVAQGILPQPYRGVLVRWRWDEVEKAVEGRHVECGDQAEAGNQTAKSTGDPILDAAMNG
jgi:predicted DNA-binding transcriptional regulator AlpA